MEPLSLEKEDRIRLAAEIQHFMAADLDVDIGNMDAERLIDFLATSLGTKFYNRGLKDAQALMARKADDIQDELYALERAEEKRG
ncbi:DUF2164 domain-containing protein [Rhodobacterales bacterium]|nr:DUF2164 domain-containing protein [Rhodobacterales bacterium]